MSLERLLEHRRIWERKPVLQTIYAVWFEALLAEIPPGMRVFEVGAGPGFLAAYARSRRPDLLWVSSDIAGCPWNDLCADALRLPFRDGSLDAIVGLDVIHHLAQPRAFFDEAARVLRPSGRIAAIEPWLTLLSYPIYRWLHHESCRLGLDPWDPFKQQGGRDKDAFAGESAMVFGLVRGTDESRWRSLGLEAPRLRLLNGFAYLLSLGFRRASLLPRRLAPLLLGLDQAATRFAARVGMRTLLVWEAAPAELRSPSHSDGTDS